MTAAFEMELERAFYGQGDHGFETSFSSASFSAKTSASQMTSILPARSTRPRQRKRSATAGRRKFILNSTLTTSWSSPTAPRAAQPDVWSAMVASTPGMNQAVLLAVTLGGHQGALRNIRLHPGQLHAQIANEVGIVEYVTDLYFQEFVHSVQGQLAAPVPRTHLGNRIIRAPTATVSHPR